MLRPSRRPGSIAAAPVVNELAERLLGAPLHLSVRCWDGSSTLVEGAPTLVVRHPRALRRMIYAPGELGLARAHVSGDLELGGDVYEALSLRDLLDEGRDLALDVRGVARLAVPLLRLGVLGPSSGPPPEEARVRGVQHSLSRDRRAITHHYDVGNDFYRLLLGPSMIYRDEVEIRLQDHREIDDGPHDAVSSIGMAEHVGLAQLPTYAGRLHALLRPGGRLLDHAVARGPAAGPDRRDPRVVPHPLRLPRRRAAATRHPCPGAGVGRLRGPRRRGAAPPLRRRAGRGSATPSGGGTRRCS